MLKISIGCNILLFILYHIVPTKTEGIFMKNSLKNVCFDQSAHFNVNKHYIDVL